MTNATKHPLVELLENVGGDYEMREYSGRGMYGDCCLGLVGSIGRIVGDIVEACLSEDIPTESRELIADAVRGMRIDSMGRDSVVYFPSVAYVDTRLCDFDECPCEATERRGALQLCEDHAQEHDVLVAEHETDDEWQGPAPRARAQEDE